MCYTQSIFNQHITQKTEYISAVDQKIYCSDKTVQTYLYSSFDISGITFVPGHELTYKNLTQKGCLTDSDNQTRIKPNSLHEIFSRCFSQNV